MERRASTSQPSGEVTLKLLEQVMKVEGLSAAGVALASLRDVGTMTGISFSTPAPWSTFFATTRSETMSGFATVSTRERGDRSSALSA